MKCTCISFNGNKIKTFDQIWNLVNRYTNTNNSQPDGKNIVRSNRRDSYAKLRGHHSSIKVYRSASIISLSCALQASKIINLFSFADRMDTSVFETGWQPMIYGHWSLCLPWQTLFRGSRTLHRWIPAIISIWICCICSTDIAFWNVLLTFVW